jgi:hypothetical protein
MGTQDTPSKPRGDALENAGRRVRVLNGPLRGASHVVRDRLTIGRASSSDIQLVDDGISRHHAQIITDEHGRHVLVDLDSSNGTFVDGQRIRRQPLAPGMRFDVMRVEMIYEVSDDDPIDAASSDVRAAALGHASGERLVATHRDGSIYEGSLVDDILEYRDLRIRLDRGDPVAAVERRAFDTLGRRLRTPSPPTAAPEPAKDGPTPTRREFERFLFQPGFPTDLRFATGDEQSATVLDLGVDGTRLRVPGHQIEHDTIVWLAIHLVSRGRAHTVVLTGRVAWTCRDHLGLGFAGALGWEHGGRKVAVRTHMDLDEQLRAARASLGRAQARRPSS